MELLTCPSCGCSVQTADALLGRRVRCFACQHTFLATIEQRKPASPAPTPRFDEVGDAERDANRGERGPFCPGCGRRIGWNDLRCPHCGEELEPEEDAGRMAEPMRRDCIPHRGSLILSLGNVSIVLGGLSLCTFGLVAALSVPIGILTLLMANHDLQRMREGSMDPRGKARTQSGRIGAIIGIILGLIFSAFYCVVWLVG